MNSMQLEWLYAIRRGVFIKLVAGVIIVLCLLGLYQTFLQTPKQVQLESINYWSEQYDAAADQLVVDEIDTTANKELIKNFYLNLEKQRAFQYNKQVDSANQLAVIEERYQLVLQAEEQLPVQYLNFLPNRASLEKEIAYLKQLVAQHINIFQVKEARYIVEIIMRYMIYGIPLFFYLALTAGVIERRRTHATLLVGIPIKKDKRLWNEWLYTVGVYYVFPTVLFVGLFIVWAAMHFIPFNGYPFLVVSESKWIGIPLIQTISSIILCQFLATIPLYYLLNVSILLLKETVLSTITIFLSTWVALFPVPVVSFWSNLQAFAFVTVDGQAFWVRWLNGMSVNVGIVCCTIGVIYMAGRKEKIVWKRN